VAEEIVRNVRAGCKVLYCTMYITNNVRFIAVWAPYSRKTCHATTKAKPKYRWWHVKQWSLKPT